MFVVASFVVAYSTAFYLIEGAKYFPEISITFTKTGGDTI
jgi:hypothetical protein